MYTDSSASLAMTNLKTRSLSHYTDYPSFTEALVGFNQMARDYGFKVGLQCSQDSIHTALAGLWTEKDLFEYALAALFCQVEEEKENFSILFKRFWLERGTRLRAKRSKKNQTKASKKSRSIAVMTNTGKSDSAGEMEEGKNTSGANAKETLKSTDFSQLNPTQSELLDDIADKLVKEMSLRIKRRKKKSNKGTINLAQSIRKNLQNGGNIIQLSHAKKKREKYRLLILLDVSGSMDKYSYYLLKFLWSLRSHFKNIEVFAFSTILKRITKQLSDKDIQIAIQNVSRETPHWSSGTKIGECLKDFNDNFSQQYLNGKTLTLIMSDGLDTGEMEVLSEAVQKIKRKSKKLIWLNPLKGMTGYEPIQEGIKTVLPELNHFGSAHNFNSLLALENILANA